MGEQVPATDIGVFCDAVQETVEMGCNAMNSASFRIPVTRRHCPRSAMSKSWL